MTTQLIPLSEYRKNIATYIREAQDKKITFIITSHGKPVGEYRPIEPRDIHIRTKYSQDFIDELAEMERNYESGSYHGPFTKEESRAYLNSLM